LCDRVAVINNGELLALGTMDELAKSLFPGVWVEIEFLRQVANDFVLVIKDLPGVQQFKPDGNVLHVQVAEKSVISDIIVRLTSVNAKITRVTPREVTLEEVYFALQNHQSGAL
jgi:ABC-2 type transport system ATP-binding protein